MFARIDRRPIARWWWTVDRWTLGGLVVLVFFGTVMSMAASPPVAERLGYDALYFTERQLGMVPFALAIMLGVSLLPPRTIRLVAISGYAQPDDIQRSLEAGFDAHVAKPAKPADIERWLS